MASDSTLWIIAGLLVVGAVAGGGALLSSLTGNLSMSQVLYYANNAGFAGQNLYIAASIAMAESGGNPSVVGDINNPVQGASSIGLWQINTYYWPQYDPSTLTDPQTNANAAFAIFQQNGSSFSKMWTTYDSGAYQSFMASAESSIPTLNA